MGAIRLSAREVVEQITTRSSDRSIRKAGLFFQNFLRHPVMLGSAIPSSRFLINRVLDSLDWPRIRIMVEYGPGVGTFTREILRRLRPDASLIAIELNLDFVSFLRDSLPDPRLRVLHGSAVDVRNLLLPMKLCQADCILSGIPYTVLPRETRRHIFLETRQVLSRDGLFVVYQYTRAVLPDLRKTFPSVDLDFEPLNILPARLFRCRKQPPYFSASRR
jgi:phospholipid N-methyltransferase